MRTLIIVCAMCTITSIVCAQPAKGLAKEKVFEVLEDEMKNTSQTVNVSLGDNPCFIDFTVSQSVFPYVMASNGVEVKRDAGKEIDKCKATVIKLGNEVFTEDSKTAFSSQIFTFEKGYDDLREKLRISVDQSVKSILREAKKKNTLDADRRFVSMPPTDYMGESFLSRSVPFEQMKELSESLSEEIAKHSELHNDTVCVTMYKSDLYRLTSEKQKILSSECYFTIDVVLHYSRSEGAETKRHVSTVHISEQALNKRREEVKKAILRHLDDIAASCHAEKVNADIEYEGPVLFEEEAVWPSLFESHAAEVSSLMSRSGKSKYGLGYKSCHPSVSISQEGGMQAYNGKTLLGYYAVDADGEKPRDVGLVENGRIVGKLGGRVIGDKEVSPTGNTRFSAYIMSPSPRYGVLHATVSKTQAKSDIRRLFMEEAKKKGLQKAYVMRSTYGFFVLEEVDVATSQVRVLNASCHVKSRNVSEEDKFSRETCIMETSDGAGMSSFIFPETMLLRDVRLVISPEETLRNWENNFTPKNKKFGL